MLRMLVRYTRHIVSSKLCVPTRGSPRQVALGARTVCRRESLKPGDTGPDKRLRVMATVAD